MEKRGLDLIYSVCPLDCAGTPGDPSSEPQWRVAWQGSADTTWEPVNSFIDERYALTSQLVAFECHRLAVDPADANPYPQSLLKPGDLRRFPDGYAVYCTEHAGEGVCKIAKRFNMTYGSIRRYNAAQYPAMSKTTVFGPGSNVRIARDATHTQRPPVTTNSTNTWCNELYKDRREAMKASEEHTRLMEDGYLVYCLQRPERGEDIANKFGMDWSEFRALNKPPGKKAHVFSCTSKLTYPTGSLFRIGNVEDEHDLKTVEALAADKVLLCTSRVASSCRRQSTPAKKSTAPPRKRSADAARRPSDVRRSAEATRRPSDPRRLSNKYPVIIKDKLKYPVIIKDKLEHEDECNGHCLCERRFLVQQTEGKTPSWETESSLRNSNDFKNLLKAYRKNQRVGPLNDSEVEGVVHVPMFHLHVNEKIVQTESQSDAKEEQSDSVILQALDLLPCSDLQKSKLRRAITDGKLQWIEYHNVKDNAHLNAAKIRVSKKLTEKIQSQFGYRRFRGLQEWIITAIWKYRSHDVVVHLPTGEGKTLLYQLPAVISNKIMVVTAPLRQLLRDQHQRACDAGIPSILLVNAKTMGRIEGFEKLAQLASTDPSVHKPKCNLIFCTPELLSANPDIQKHLQALHKAHRLMRFVIDESHEVNGKRSAYHSLSDVRNACFPAFENKQGPDTPCLPILAMSAIGSKHTIDKLIKSTGIIERHAMEVSSRPDCTEAQKSPICFKGNFMGAQKNLQYSVYRKVERLKGQADLRHATDLIKGIHGGCTIVYCLQRTDCNEVAEALASEGINACAYHGQLEDEAKNELFDAWMKGGVQVLCATTALGLGIDKQDVRMILHFSPPLRMEDYYQQCGRAGRDGKPSRCVLFYHPTDFGIAHNILCFKEGKRSIMTKDVQNCLNEVYHYCQNFRDCRQLSILKAAGSFVKPGFACRGCDVCLGVYPQVHDVTRQTNQLLRWIKIQSNVAINTNQAVRIVDARDELVSILQKADNLPLKLNKNMCNAMIEEWWLALQQGGYVSKVNKTKSLQPGKDMESGSLVCVTQPQVDVSCAACNAQINVSVTMHRHKHYLRPLWLCSPCHVRIEQCKRTSIATHGNAATVDHGGASLTVQAHSEDASSHATDSGTVDSSTCKMCG